MMFGEFVNHLRISLKNYILNKITVNPILKLALSLLIVT